MAMFSTPQLVMDLIAASDGSMEEQAAWDLAGDTVDAARWIASHGFFDLAIGGRMNTIPYRRQQLENLHQALTKEADVLCEALVKDSMISRDCGLRHRLVSPAEAQIEHFFATQAVLHFLEKGLDKNRIGVGLAAVCPTFHTRLYSITCAVAACLAAGNSVYLELCHTPSQHLDVALERLFTEALAKDAVYPSLCPEETLERLSSECGEGLMSIIDQTENYKEKSIRCYGEVINLIASSTDARVLAYVDKSADIDNAAAEIVRARFAFGGTSPYAPDLVMVHESVKEQFIQACLKQEALATSSLSPGLATNDTVRDSWGQRYLNKRKDLADAFKIENRKVKRIEPRGDKEKDPYSVVEITDAYDLKFIPIPVRMKGISPLLTKKITLPCILVLPFTSLVDAVFGIKGGEGGDKKPYDPVRLAAYIFSTDAGATEYYMQHIRCRHVIAVNQIPLELLLGPAAPLDSLTLCDTPAPLHRYHTHMLSVPASHAAEYTPQQMPESFKEAEALMDLVLKRGTGQPGVTATAHGKDDDGDDKAISEQADKVRRLATQPLVSKGQKKIKQPVDYFESGLFVGAGIVASVVLPVLGFTGYFLGKMGLKLLRG